LIRFFAVDIKRDFFGFASGLALGGTIEDYEEAELYIGRENISQVLLDLRRKEDDDDDELHDKY